MMMKRISILSVFTLFLLILNTITAKESNNDIFGRPFFLLRSQGDDLARRYAGEAPFLINCNPCDNLYGTFSTNLGYTQNFKNKELAQFLFFNNTDTMIFGGQNIPPENKDVNGINFLLADDFEGSVTARPCIKNVFFDIYFRIYPSCWTKNFYFEFIMPLVWTEWDMRLKQQTNNKGTTIAANTLGNTSAQPAPVNSIIHAWKGVELSQTTTFEDWKEPMTNGLVQGRQTRVGVADLELVLGYNFICNDCGHLGLNLRIKNPTGSRPDGQLLFQPIVGNGRHTQLGLGLSADFTAWQTCKSSISFWFVGALYHLFAARQERTFDLKENGPGSRYLLFKSFGLDNLYTGSVVPGTDVTTLEAHIRNDIVGEALFLINIEKCGVIANIGYEIWGRTKEKINITGEIPGRFGIKGDGPTSGLNTNRTASKTRIDGTNGDQFDGGIGGDESDNIYLTLNDLDVKRAENQSVLTHKLFGHIGYAWDINDLQPFVGLGGFVELSGKGNRALNQWGIWLKTGLVYV